MATAAIRCPFCQAWMRVSVQASTIRRTDQTDQLLVEFDPQRVAHICKQPGEARPHLTAPGPSKD